MKELKIIGENSRVKITLQELRRLEQDFADARREGLFWYCFPNEIPEKISLLEKECADNELEIQRLRIERIGNFSREPGTAQYRQVDGKSPVVSFSSKAYRKEEAKIDREIAELNLINELLQNQILILWDTMGLIAAGDLVV